MSCLLVATVHSEDFDSTEVRATKEYFSGKNYAAKTKVGVMRQGFYKTRYNLET